jgi:4-amino-4-deoxy-L-arabinose transferase-like glycosyltransferase
MKVRINTPLKRLVTDMKKIMASFLSEDRAPYVLFVLAVLAHVVVFYALLYFYGPCSFFLSNDCTVNNNDTQHYVTIAENLSHGNGYSRFPNPPYEADALRTPLLPLYFAPFTFFGGYRAIWLAVLLLNIILSLAPLVLYKLARFFLPHAHALITALMLVFEPLYLYRSQIAEPDAVFVLLLISAMYFLVRSWKENKNIDLFSSALILGLAILAKPSAEYLAMIIFFFEAIFLAVIAKDGVSVRLKKMAAMVAIVFVVVSPWLIRNKIVFGVTALSSIQGYNLYTYYTVHEKLPYEEIPSSIIEGSREPSRYLPYQSFFTHIALARIKAHPIAYAKEQLVGSLRNLFVSDISQIYYYGHTRLLPFPYNPESKTNIHELLLSGNISGAFKSLFEVIPKIVWIMILASLYAIAVYGWLTVWWRDRVVFITFTMFLALFGYLILASGPFVDAKYRLPALPFIFIISLYGLECFLAKYALHRRAK